jgi:hypothetical protein
MKVLTGGGDRRREALVKALAAVGCPVCDVGPEKSCQLFHWSYNGTLLVVRIAPDCHVHPARIRQSVREGHTTPGAVAAQFERGLPDELADL